ncbi:MAG: glycosyltransferase [Bacteroidales bacterium]
MNTIEIITVHYKTPKTLLNMLKSLEQHENNRYPIRIIDGSGCKYEEVEQYVTDHENIRIEYFGYNIHHGPGLNYGISSSTCKFVLCVDSDMVVLKPVIGRMLRMIGNNYAVGKMVELNESIVLETRKGTVEKNSYLHPGFMLINRLRYPQFYPFIKHGAPCILTMADIHLQKLGHLLIDFPDFKAFIKKENGGTRQKFGSCLLGIPHRSIEISPVLNG